MDSIGLGNVDERLRSVFGDEYGLVVETAPGAGTKVTVRVPKFAAGCAHEPDGLPRARRRRRAAGAATSWPSCSAATSGSARRRPAARPPRRCGCCAARASTWCFLDIAMPGLDGLELADGPAPVPPAARGRLRDRPRRPRGRRLRPPRRRLRAQAGARGAAARGRPPGGRRRRAPRRRRRAASRSSSAGSPGSSGAPRCATSTAQGDYVRLHTATEQPPACGCRSATLEERWARRRVRAHPPQHPGRARATSTRCGSVPASRWSWSTAPSCRSAAGTCPSCASCCVRWLTDHPQAVSHERRTRRTGTDHQSADRRPCVARAALERGRDRRADPARRGLRASLIRAQLRLASYVVVAARAQPRQSAAALPPGARRPTSTSSAIPLAWLLLGFAVYPWLLVLAWWYVRRAERNEAAFEDLVDRPESP